MRYPAIDIQIAACLLAAVRPALAPGDVGIVVILMDGAGHLSDVNDRNTAKERIFNQPLIEPRTANRERWHLGIYVSRKYKRVDRGMVARDTRRQKLKAHRPIRCEIRW